MASLQHHVATWLAFGLITGCGGDRSRAAAGMDTTGAAVVTPDSAATPVGDTSRRAAPVPADSTRSAMADTGRKTPPTGAEKPSAPRPAATDTGVKRTAARPSTANKTATAEPEHDTATEGQKAESTSAAAPAPAAPAPTAAAPGTAPSTQPPTQQDTSKASAGGNQELRDAYHQAPRDTVSQAVYNGWKQFNLNCARCHGEDVLGTTIAPHLIMSLKPDGPINSKQLFVQTVCAGRPEKGMPAWCALGLEMDKINDIYEYVKGRSDAKIGPGRPAVKQQG
jgi:mono/diheme cytochrome c family protein